MGELSRQGASFGMNNALCRLETPLEVVHNLVSTPLERLHAMFVHEGSPSLGSNHVIPNPLYYFHVSTMRSQPSSSFPELDFDMPLIILRFVILM